MAYLFMDPLRLMLREVLTFSSISYLELHLCNTFEFKLSSYVELYLLIAVFKGLSRLLFNALVIIFLDEEF
jgi:hypothetical protein